VEKSPPIRIELLDFGDEEISFCEKGLHLEFIVCGAAAQDPAGEVDACEKLVISPTHPRFCQSNGNSSRCEPRPRLVVAKLVRRLQNCKLYNFQLVNPRFYNIEIKIKVNFRDILAADHHFQGPNTIRSASVPCPRARGSKRSAPRHSPPTSDLTRSRPFLSRFCDRNVDASFLSGFLS
jgi:hypothetical protein